MEAKLEDEGKKGFVMRLQPELKDDPIYSEHWEGHEELKVTVEPDRILVQRAGEPNEKDEKDEKDDKNEKGDKGDDAGEGDED